MKPYASTFTEIYTQWLDSLRAMIPGAMMATSPREPTSMEAQVTAHQEWEDEGGSIKPPKKAPVRARGRKTRR